MTLANLTSYNQLCMFLATAKILCEEDDIPSPE